jgi:hypothetical protein
MRSTISSTNLGLVYFTLTLDEMIQQEKDNEKVKKLKKQLMLKYHPDKVKNDDPVELKLNKKLFE